MEGGREMSLFNKVWTHHEICAWLSRHERKRAKGNAWKLFIIGPRRSSSLEVQGKEIGKEGGRVGLKCENKYWRESKKMRKESGMETRPRRGFWCGRIYPSPPRGGENTGRGECIIKNTRKERCFPGIKILYPRVWKIDSSGSDFSQKNNTLCVCKISMNIQGEKKGEKEKRAPGMGRSVSVSYLIRSVKPRLKTLSLVVH